MKHASRLGLLLTACICLMMPKGIAAQRQRLSHRVVQVDAGDIEDSLGKPVARLVSAQQLHCKARYFRVNWWASIGGWASTDTVLYDRHKKTVKLYSLGGERDSVYLHREHYLFTGVTDAIFEHLAQDLILLKQREGGMLDSGDTSTAFFDELPKYGCIKHPYPDTSVFRYKQLPRH